MSPDPADIVIRLQKRAWVLLLVPFLFAAFVTEMLRLGINPLWWVPPLVLISLAVAVILFKTPFAIVIRPSTKTIELRYPIARRPHVYSFDELDFIKSYVSFSGEADVYVELEVRLKSGKRIPLAKEHAAWNRSAPVIGTSGAEEPQDLTSLRRKISSTTGVRDLGFCN
jgi:hypothetical protein